MKKTFVNIALMGSLAVISNIALADCSLLPTHAELKATLDAAQDAPNGGFGLEMWGTLVDRDGVVCAVAFTGGDRGAQWPGSRAISAQKANTANAFSLPDLALSTEPTSILPLSPAAAYLACNIATLSTLLRLIKGHRKTMDNPMTL